MKRYTLLLVALLVGVTFLKAKPVDYPTVEKAAREFAAAQALQSRQTQEMDLVYTGPEGAFYVFNFNPTGFVIIAGDDAYRPVIGYSTETAFDASDIPPALADYLGGIAEHIRQLGTRGGAEAAPSVVAEWESVLNHGRLLSRYGGRGVDYFCQTQWNQDYPYNCCCPDDPDGSGGHAIVGCLATAMSQLMRFWAFPAQGIGSHCYVHEDYGEICADFGATTYDWEHMPNKLSNNSSDEEKLAVGTLCFHCGVTIDMGYGPDGSGGASGPIPGVMHTYFDYCDAIVQLSRNDFELENWKRMVREQFDMGWPMYYGGCQDGGCHAFVCDGYDDFDMFHFNLGWGGGSDGWYIIDEAPYTSPADAMFNFVPSTVYAITPDVPTAFSVEVPVNTELHTLLQWTNPTTSLDGTPLSSIEEMVVMRNNQIVQVLTDMAPGQTVEWEDTDVPYYSTYEYAVYAKANGRYGKHAYALDVSVGPTCPWKVVMSTSNFQGWNGGCLSIQNGNGTQIANYTLTSSVPQSVQPELPLGMLYFIWTAPEIAVDLSIIIKDADNETVYSYSGSSNGLPSGVFFETNNSCGGALDCGVPDQLEAESYEEGILLTWDPVVNEGYGYNLYRDGQLIRLIPAGTVTSFLDEKAEMGGHCYRMAVLCDGGESGEFSNMTCATEGPCYPARNLDYEITETFKIKLSWELPNPNDGLSGFFLYRKREGEEYHRIKLLNGTTTSFVDNGTHEEGDYYYQLFAYYQALDCTSSPANYRYDTNVFELHAYYSPTGLTEPEVEEIEGEVTVYNLLGQQVASEWEGLPAGVYLLRIENSHGVTFKKIIHP